MKSRHHILLIWLSFILSFSPLYPQNIDQLGPNIIGEAAGDNSGWAVSLSGNGNRIAIGAPANDGNGNFSGHVRVYEWIDPYWVIMGSDIDSEATGDFFGESVALSANGTRLVVGAPANDGGGDASGHARVYQWNDSTSTWVQLGGDLDGEAARDNFGSSVAISAEGNKIAIGAVYNRNRGHVRIYEWNDSLWVQMGADIEGEGSGDFFGNSVALWEAMKQKR